MPGDSALTVSGLDGWRGSSHVLQGVDLSVADGEAVAVVGRNGVGKTTLVESIFQMGPRTVGEIRFAGQRLDQMVTSQMMSLGIALVPQGRRLFRSLSVAEHLQLAARKVSTSSPEDVYEMFPILEDRGKYPATSLSGGERSMLAIARAIVTNPRFVVMDEPTEGLAPLLVRKIRETLLEMKQRGVTILLVEQNLDLAMKVSDRLLVMDRGTIVDSFATDRINNVEEIRELIVLGRE